MPPAVKPSPISAVLWVVVSAGSGLMAIGLVITFALLVSSPFINWSDAEVDIPVSVKVDAQTLHIAAPSLGIDRARLDKVRGHLIFPPLKENLYSGLAGLVVILAAALWVLLQLRAILRTLSRGEPFTKTNVTRVRRIGLAVIAAAVGGAIVEYVSNYFAMRYFTGSGITFDAAPNINVFAIICGFLILAIAEVFAAGARLEEEQSLTV